jgi:tRNA (cmo5U34)-methyltransferase
VETRVTVGCFGWLLRGLDALSDWTTHQSDTQSILWRDDGKQWPTAKRDLMPNRQVADFFNALSGDYTSTIERCFPRYREMLWALLDYLPCDRPFASILELGCGTGNLSVLLREAFPTFKIHVVDISGDSLDVCRSRLGPESQVIYEQQDFRSLEYEPSSFDLVVSSISVHHLTASEKQTLFRRVHEWLKPDGVFSYADQFRGATDDLYARHIQNWKRESLDAGSTEEEFEMWMDHQQEHDHHDTLKNQFDWLSDAGFAAVDCSWRYLLWSVVQARKLGADK